MWRQRANQEGNGEKDKQMNREKLGRWSLRDLYLKEKRRTFVSLHKERNHILFLNLHHPPTLQLSSSGCVYLNVYLNGECYCSNHGWHHSASALFLLPPYLLPPEACSLLLLLRPCTHSTHTDTHTAWLCHARDKFMNHWCTNQPQAYCE